MTSLKEEPRSQIRSLDEFFAIAHAIESDAVARYTETAKLLRGRGEQALAAVFDRLAETERGHVEQVQQWAEHRLAMPPQVSALPWAIPDTHDASPQEMARSKLFTPYRALATAVRHEERAFAFWTYVSAHSIQAEVKEAAERMALEELEHVSLLRRERRKAYHQERQKVPTGSAVSPAFLSSLELLLATYCEHHPILAAGEDLGKGLASDAHRSAESLVAIPPDLSLIVSPPNLPPGAENDPIAISEFLAEAYLHFAETSSNADTLALAQRLAGVAVYRLAVLTAATGVAEA
jgi:rubrerythrin